MATAPMWVTTVRSAWLLSGICTLSVRTVISQFLNCSSVPATGQLSGGKSSTMARSLVTGGRHRAGAGLAGP